jgi:hypothetical protein
MSAKILILDVETAPNLVYTWRFFNQNINLNQIVNDNYMLCWSAKWLGEKSIKSDILTNYKDSFNKDPKNEIHIARSIWDLLNKADIVVTHNGDNFDIKWLNFLFLKYKLGPTKPYKTIDTLKVARANFYFPSKKLEYIATRLSVGEKIKTEGFELWTNTMLGNKDACYKMIQYNKKDVEILESVYLEMQPFIKNHPNLSAYVDNASLVCPVCLSSDLQKRGYYINNSGKYQQYWCKTCGRWPKGKENLLDKNKRLTLLSNS